MLVEIITAVVLIQGLGLLSQLIERRRDVFYYVSKPDPRWQNRRLDLQIRKAAHALNRHVKRAFDPSRKETKWGAPSWRAIGDTHSRRSLVCLVTPLIVDILTD
jgi:hypothetical protein